MHEKDAELMVVLQGAGNIVTGGKLVNEKRTNANNLSGTSIEGGNSQTVIKGDSLSFSIAAASVVAKVTRDRIMRALAPRYPGYGWETNVGYATPAHGEAIRRLGVTRHHRRSFAPVQLALAGELPLFAAFAAVPP